MRAVYKYGPKKQITTQVRPEILGSKYFPGDAPVDNNVNYTAVELRPLCMYYANIQLVSPFWKWSLAQIAHLIFMSGLGKSVLFLFWSRDGIHFVKYHVENWAKISK